MESKTDMFSGIINILTILVTIFGFFITYNQMKKQYQLEMKKEKKLYAINEMKEVVDNAYDFLWTYMKAITCVEKKQSINEKYEKERDKFRNLRWRLGELIIKFGSLDSVKIWTYFEHNLISGWDGESIILDSEYNNYYMISLLILIISQLKYDIYEIEVSPKYIFMTLFSDKMMRQNNFFNIVKEFNNKIINELKLNDFLLISDEKI